MKTLWKSLTHPALRPVLLGVLGFVVLNGLFTLGVTFSPLNQRFNFKYGNFLPAKLQQLKAIPSSKVDVLFLGTSQTNNGFMPTVFDQAWAKLQNGNSVIQSFNLGLPNNQYDIMLAYLRFHQQRYGKPRLLLVELSPSIQQKDASQYYLPALYYRTLIEQAPVLAGDYLGNPLLGQNVKDELLASSWSSLHQYRYTFAPVNLLGRVGRKVHDYSGWGEASAAVPESAAYSAMSSVSSPEANESETIEPEKGWYPKPQSMHMTTPAGVRLSVTEARKYYVDQQKDVNFEKLGALLNYCEQEQIKVVLVTWPNHPAFLREFRRSPLSRDYAKGLQGLLSKHQVPFVDLNQAVSMEQAQASEPVVSDLFADPRHLTPKGARLFTEMLTKKLAETLPSKS